MSGTAKAESFPCLQARLACHGFIGAGRRYKTPGSDTKNFISHDNTGSPWLLSPMGAIQRQAQVNRCCAPSGPVTAEEP